jgi:hypothetical protein
VRCLWIVLCACGRLSFDPAPGDGGTKKVGDAMDAAGVMDTADAMLPACNHAMPFGAPVALASLNSAGQDYSARLSPDELTVWFASDRAGTDEIFTATRTSLTVPFANITAVANVSVAGENTVHPTVTGDELALYEQVGTGGGGVIEVATRATTTNAFSTPAVSSVDSPQDDIMPFVAPDGTQLYFASNRGGTYRIYVATGSGGTFGTPALAPIPASGGSYADEMPVLSNDGLALYFASSRTDPAFDIHVATRSVPSGAFTAVAHVATVSVTGPYDGPTWLSPDNCRLYLMSTNTGNAEFDLFVATR